MIEVITSIIEKGDCCMKDEKYEEAILHYTHAIKINSKIHSLYSNRSLAFLKIQHYFLALEDAKEAIRLKPDWAKGYFRKAEVEFQTFNFLDALMSYKTALSLQPNDPSLENAVEKTKIAIKKEKANDEQIPWIGAAMGIFIGTLIVVADQILTVKPFLCNPIIMFLVTVGVATVGYAIATVTGYYIKSQRKSLLCPPVNLFTDEEENQSDNKEFRNEETKIKYSKFQEQGRMIKVTKGPIKEFRMKQTMVTERCNQVFKMNVTEF